MENYIMLSFILYYGTAKLYKVLTDIISKFKKEKFLEIFCVYKIVKYSRKLKYFT